MNYQEEIKRLNEKIEFLSRTNMLYSDWEHRDTQVTSDLIRKGIEEHKINKELREEIERLKQRPWVSLTDEELDEAMHYWSDKSRSAYGGAFRADGEYVDMIATWRYIEAKVKELNT
jgi:hypothetical protein